MRQENYHRDEDDAERDQVGELVAEQPRQEFARELYEGAADFYEKFAENFENGDKKDAAALAKFLGKSAPGN